MASLTADGQGRLYGTTEDGGSSQVGTVFRLTRPSSGSGDWTEEVLHSFNTTDGALPTAPVLIASDGSVYGVTLEGGPANRGIVFGLANLPGWPITVLHAFDLNNGGYPRAGLIFGQNGLLYGTTGYVSDATYRDAGTDFNVSPLGDTVEFKVLHAFGMPGDGLAVYGLTAAPAAYPNSFIGVAQGDSSRDLGTVYTLQTIAGGGASEHTSYYFGYAPDVSAPTSPPIIGTGGIKGSFYGCAPAGGTHRMGGIYMLTPIGNGGLAETVIYNFGDQPDDPNPAQNGTCAVIQGGFSGILYGTTPGGGAHNNGTFFELDPPKAGGKWTEKVDVSFYLGSGGGEPTGAPLLLNGLIYGSMGLGDNGAIYELTP